MQPPLALMLTGLRLMLTGLLLPLSLLVQDLALWKRLAEMSSEQGLVRQAIYCLTQVGGAEGGRQ